MPLKPESNLRHKALDHCQQHIKSMLDAKIEIVPDTSELDWDSNLQRHIFQQGFQVWRDFDTVQAVVTPDGQVKELRIAGRFAGANDLVGVPELTSDEALKICETTGLLGDTAMIKAISRNKAGMCITQIIQVEHALPNAMTIMINPLTKQVAAYRITDSR